MENQIQQVLPGVPAPTVPPRPTRGDEDQLREAAKALAPRVIEWQNGTDDPKGIEDDIFEAIDESIEMDGYEMAQHLEDLGWRVDAELVRILDAARSEVYEAHKRAVYEWVQTYRIKPAFKVGDGVFADIVGEKFERHDNCLGQIIKIDEELAEYYVCCPSLGHLTPEDVEAGKRGTTAVILAYERVRATQT